MNIEKKQEGSINLISKNESKKSLNSSMINTPQITASSVKGPK
jgi:hypothetical protein